MNVGLLVSFRNPPQWQMPWPEFYEETLQQIQLAEELGYDQVWLTEHHFAEDGYSPSLFPLAGAIAARTSRIRIGFYLLLLPLHHPVAVAEAAAAVDILSNGRFDLGVGQGYSKPEFDGYGANRAERPGRLEEGMTAIRGMLSEDNYSFKGKYFDFKDVNIVPKGPQTPHMPLWIGAMTPKSVSRVGRMGCHYLGLGEPGLQDVYDGALREAGHNPEDFGAAHLRWVHVAENQDQAWDNSQDHLHYLLSVYARWLDEASQDSDYTGESRIPAPDQLRYADNALLGAPLIGTPDQVAAGVDQLTKSCRTTHVVLGMHLPGLAPAKIRSSMELFAQEVLPGLR